jgi:hypothetical protein
MSESKFANIFQNAKATSTEPPQEPPPPPQRPPQEPPPPRGEKPTRTPRPLGRPPGKRSDPAWKQFSVLLKKETQREAANILRDKEGGQDLSGLVQSLLDNWLKRQKT